MTTSSHQMLTLVSSDGDQFKMDVAAALKSQPLKHMIEDDCVDGVIPIQNASNKILAKVIEYCQKHVEHEAAKADDAELKEWDAEFVKVDMDTMFYLMQAANYLEIKSLLDLTCQTVADIIKGKTPEEIRKIFNIKNDFIPEEEEQIRKENQWAFA